MQQNDNSHPAKKSVPNGDTIGNAQVVGVQSGGEHTFSKARQASIRLIENYGIEGDAHAGATDQHLFHIKRFGAHPNLRQVHLIQTEFFDEIARLGHDVGPGDLGENIATRGIDMLKLPTGTKLSIGNEAVIELTGLRNPCHQINDFQAGLLQHCKVATADGVMRKAGVMAIVLCSGIVQPGDGIHVTLPPMPHQSIVYRTPIKG